MPLVVLVSTDTKMRRKGGGRRYTDRHGDRFFPPPLSGLWTDTSRLNTVQQEKTTIWDYITVSSYSFHINNNGSNRNTRLRQKEEAWRVPALDRKGQIGVKGSRRFAPHVPEQLSAKEAFRSSSPRGANSSDSRWTRQRSDSNTILLLGTSSELWNWRISVWKIFNFKEFRVNQ